MRALGLAALLAALALPGSPARAAPGARLTITGTGTGTPPPAARAQPGRPAALTVQARPGHPRAGEPVTLSVTDPPAGATDYSWDLTGSGIYTSVAGARAQVQTTFTAAGIHSVGVQVTAGGVLRQGVLVLTVQPAPESGSRPVVRMRAVRRSDSVRAARLDVRSASDTRSRPATGSRPATRSRPATGSRPGSVAAPAARLAGDPGVTIADFHFTPSATTVHVGDTITWTNNGPSSHTATATNGGFNTGILKKGQSASHTFTQAGTFTYICQIHPFMHGTIVVLASTTTTTTTSTQTSAQASAPTTSTASSTSTAAAAAAGTGGAPTLPLTGLDVLSGLAAGLLLIGLGVALRRTLAR